MKSTAPSESNSWKYIVFLSLVFLTFFQLVSDFIESVYTFGLLGTDIPPEMVSVVLFFTPLALLFVRRTPSLRVALILAADAALLRALEIVLPPAGKMLAGGLGVGVMLVLLPILLANTRRSRGLNAVSMSAGLALSLAFSILLRSLGAGSDISTIFPSIGWVLCALLLGSTVILLRVKEEPLQEDMEKATTFGKTLSLSIGFLGALLVLYFGFVSPAVLARWSGVDLRLILLTLAVALCLYFLLQANEAFKKVSRGQVLLWNALFIFAGTVTIWINQTVFPMDSSAYPLFQAQTTWIEQIPLFLMLLLSPVVLLDIRLVSAELAERKPSMRQLAGGFALAALLFLLIVLAQVFTTVYDYIPVIGPWFRDRFWLVFLAAGLSLGLPVWLVKTHSDSEKLPLLRTIFFPILLSCMLLAVVVSVMASPVPETPQQPSSLRVLTYNLQQGYDETGRRAYLEQLAVIRSFNPDIIGLQETDTARFSGGNGDLVRTIAQGLNMYTYYGPKTVAGTFGIALLSRYPLENPQTFYMYSAGEQTAAILAEIVVNGTRYNVVVTHLGNGGPMIQQEQVLAAMDGKENVIAMGDFNFRPDTDQYALTRQTYESAWELAGPAFTPGLDTADLIDHVFVSPGVDVSSAEYILSPVSDHPGLVVDILP